MNIEQAKVAEFMHAAGQSVRVVPTLPPETQIWLGIKLIQEELEELKMAMLLHKDLTLTFDALCDLLYTVLWLANASGLPMEKGFNEVHRSNMSKFIDGYRAENGKWCKGPSYSPPNLHSIIAETIINATKQNDESDLSDNN